MFAGCRRLLSPRARGFTLIDLVVVLAILGILISLAVPRYLGVRKKAYKAEADNLLQEAKTQSIQITMSGKLSPLGPTDNVWITLSGDGSSPGGATF